MQDQVQSGELAIKRADYGFTTSGKSDSSDTDEEGSFASNPSFEAEYNRTVFQETSAYVRSSCVFRVITWIYAERKLVVAFMAHFFCTVIIWGHFGIVKFQEQEQKVPDDTPFYWWKRVVPPLEFGSMHAILFQMSLIPLTMSRLSIANASSTFLNKFIPFNRTVQFHIHLGYTMVAIVFFSTILFFTFFGLLCNSGDQNFCDKFTSEIMITGYVILAFLLMIGVTSFFRDVIPYELFYRLHFLVFAMYAVATAHTFDNVHRNSERVRSQNFKWYAAPLLYYFCDRAAMHINHRYRTKVAAATVVTSSKGTGMVIIKLHRPFLFTFEPGQYALLRIPKIDQTWHPYSIASGPESEFLEFYIEVHGAESWTDRLWCMINTSQFSKDSLFDQHREINVEVKGPYGTPFGNTDEFSHSIAIGSGTGIVPITSLLKKHVHSLVRLDPKTFFNEQKLRNKKIQRVYNMHEKKNDSILSYLFQSSTGVYNPIRHQLQNLLPTLPETHTNSFTRSIHDLARLPIYLSILLLFLPILGIIMLGLTFSVNSLKDPNFNGIEIKVFAWQVTTLKVGTLIFQVLFLLVAMAVHNRAHFFTCTDVVVSVISFLVDWYWFDKDLWGNFGASELVYYSLIVFYMTLRSWNTAVGASEKSWQKYVCRDGIYTMNRLSFIWVTRSADLVSEILPDIVDMWDTLCSQWGEEHARKVCDVSIYVTDTDKEACSALTTKMENTSLYQVGAIKLERPDFAQIIEDHTMERVEETCSSPQSNTLLAYCGSPRLSSVISEAKIINDMSTFITGNRMHHVQFVSETYGASKMSQKKVYYTREDADCLACKNGEMYDTDDDNMPVHSLHSI